MHLKKGDYETITTTTKKKNRKTVVSVGKWKAEWIFRFSTNKTNFEKTFKFLK